MWGLETEGSSPAGLSTLWAPSMSPSASLCRVSCRIGVGAVDGLGPVQHITHFPSSPGSPHSCRCVTEEQQGSWPWVITLIRGALMGTGFLLTYVLTWLYYTR